MWLITINYWNSANCDFHKLIVWQPKLEQWTQYNKEKEEVIVELISHENRQIKITYFYKHNFKLCVKLKEKHQQTNKKSLHGWDLQVEHLFKVKFSFLDR